MNRPEKIGLKTAIALFCMALAFNLILTGCGGGSGSSSTPTKTTVTVTGKVAISSQYEPLQGAECRLVDNQGDELAAATSDEEGQYTLNVAKEVEGHIYCTPPGFSNLALSTYCSTKALSSSDTLENEDVTILSTVAAQVIASEAPDEPLDRKAELLAVFADRQDADLNLVAELSERLYAVLLHNSLDIDFSGQAGCQEEDGVIRGRVSSGLDATPIIAGARCQFAVDGPLSQGYSAFYTAVLADFYNDGMLNRPDLQTVQQQINDDYDGHQQEVADVLSRVFPKGIGHACTTTTDETGAYSLAVPPDMPGYVCCTPPDQEKMMLSAYVPGHARGESFSDQDVTPATTVHSVLIASRLNNSNAELSTTKNNFYQDINGLQVKMVQTDGAVTGFELLPDTTPANQEVGLAAFTATVLFNTLYQNQLNVDFSALMETFFNRQELDSERLILQGVEAGVAQACAEVVETSVNQAEAVLGTQLSHAMSTARFKVTVRESPGGPPVPGASIQGQIDPDETLNCAGCDTATNDQGRVDLSFSGLSDEILEIKLYAHHDDYGYSGTEVVPIVPMVVQDITLTMSSSHFLQVHGAGDFGEPDIEYDGSGSVTSHDSQIDCSIIDGIGDPSVLHPYSDTFFLKSYCKSSFASGATITLTAEPSVSSTFAGWQTDGTECSGTDPVCAVTMDDYKEVFALFLPQCDQIRTEKLFRVWRIYRALSAESTGDDTYLSIYDDFPDSCGALTATATANWITLSQADGVTNQLRLSENPDAGPRTGTIMLDGAPVTIAQDGQQCAIADYAVTPVTAVFDAAGGTGTIDVQAPDNCPWQAVSDTDWMSITSGEPDSGGHGTVTYFVQENQGDGGRGGTITIAGTHHMVVQGDASATMPASLTIQGEGDGAGTITTYQISGRDLNGADQWKADYECNIAGANASGKCNQIYALDTKVQLQVETTWKEADSNFIFSNWTGSCSGFYEECLLNMDQMHTVGARFVTSHQADLVIEELASYEANRSVKDDYLPIGVPINVTTRGGYQTIATYQDRVYLRIANRGVSDAQNFSIGLYISSDDVITSDDILLAQGRLEIDNLAAKETLFNIESEDIDPLSPGNGRDHEVWIPTDLAPGPAYLGVIVDESDQVTEDIETNNSYAIPVYLVNADEGS